MSHRVLLVDDHPVVREGFRSLLRMEPDFEVRAEAGSAEEAVGLAREVEVDVAVVDLSLPGANGLEFVKQLRALSPEIRILVVSAHEEDLYADRAFQAGASGYLMKHKSAALFVDAVRRVADGGLFLSEPLQQRFLERRLGRDTGPTSDLDALTDRELEVFEHFGHGNGTREVAEAMNLSIKTIESHRSNIKRKLDLASATEFVQRAALWVESPLFGGERASGQA